MPTLSDTLGTLAQTPAAVSWIDALSGIQAGFAADQRFDADARAAAPPAQSATDEDSLADRVAEAFEQGRQQGLAEAMETQQAEDAHRARLRLALTRLDTAMAEDLKRQLADAVIALCETTLAPLAVDPALLNARCERAVHLLSEQADEVKLYLHPDDIPSLEDQFAQRRKVRPDASLERGAIRVEGPEGGYTDGPDEWRRMLEEAVAAC